jgi:hypothetical protein
MNIAVVLILIFLLAAGKNQRSVTLGNIPIIVTYAGTSKYYGTDKDWNVAATWPNYWYRSMSNIYDQYTLTELKERYPAYDFFRVSDTEWADWDDLRNDNQIPGKYILRRLTHSGWNKSQDWDYDNPTSFVAKEQQNVIDNAYSLAKDLAPQQTYYMNGAKTWTRVIEPKFTYPKVTYLKSFHDEMKKNMTLQVITNFAIELFKQWILKKTG